MTESQKQPRQNESPSRNNRRWKTCGVIVLVLGAIGAAVAYWHGMQSESLNDDPSMFRYNKAEHRQMGVLYGQAGYLIDDFTNSLQEPGTQAVLIGVTSVVVAAGCFYMGSLSRRSDETDSSKPSDSNTV